MSGLSPTQSPRERLDRVRLIRSQNVGPVTFRKLIERYDSASVALDALPDLARRGGMRKSLWLCSAETAMQEMEAVSALGGSQLIIGDPDYPDPLGAIPDAPPVLSVLGNVELLSRTAIGMVGARNASTNGKRFAEKLAGDLSRAGILVASGLARGVDAAVHTGALDGGTVAVVAGGVDVIYPRENAELYGAIRERGVIVSEMPPGTEPLARHFPSRNRIISGLSLGIIVVEAALRSGSLITARLAGEQGREVFAIPGSPLDPRARGANDLIRNGATLVETAEHVLEGVRAMHGRKLGEPKSGDFIHSQPDDSALETARKILLECLGPSPVSVDDLLRETQLSNGVVWAVLLELELAGRLERQAGGKVALLFS